MARIFLNCFLPELFLDSPPELSLDEVEFFVRLNLSASEMRNVEKLYTLYDIENVRLWLLGLPMTQTGRFSHEELQELLKDFSSSPIPGTEVFCSLYPTLFDRQQHAHELMRCFFKNERNLSPFLRRYFELENGSRLILAHLRAKTLNRPFPIDPEELGFDIEDTFSWPEWFQPLLHIWDTKNKTPYLLEEALTKWKFDAVDALCSDNDLMAIGYVLAYLIKLRIVEARQRRNEPRHKNTLERMVKGS